MRLHHLQISAFGPFAGTVTVDFDALGATGLFLLTGPTGAGKSSVLDAVCFALYGEVPGDRQQARHLRSDHAAEGAVPEVVLTASIVGRTFRFTRSPAWERPKRRGTGTTRQQPRVLVEEQVDGTWTGSATRLDDAGLLVTSLLGMTCGQFTQVALLPQGRFQAFLRASSTERHAVLQRLFHTDRFERVEHWLAEHRSELRRRSDALGLKVAGQVHRLQEAGAAAGAAAVPDGWVPNDLDGPAARGEVATWAADVAATAAQAHADALLDHTTALAAATECEARLAAARQAIGLLAEAAAARSELADLDAEATAAEESARALAAHRRAATVAPAARAARAADAVAVAAAQEARRALEDAGLATTPLDAARSAIDAACEQVEARRTALRSALPRITELERRRAELSGVLHGLASDRAAWAEARAATAHLPDTLRLVQQDERLAVAAAADAAPSADALTAALSGRAAAREAVRLAAQVEEGRTALLAATEAAQQLRETYLDAREARIASIASELAVSLVSGCSCPVCGSIDHPAPATGSAPATRRETEDAARRTYEDAETARMALHEAQAARVARLEAVQDASGGRSVAAWETCCSDAEARVALAQAATEEAARLAGQQDALRRQLDETSAAVAVLEIAVARGEERVSTLQEGLSVLVTELTADLGTALGPESPDSSEDLPSEPALQLLVTDAEQRSLRLRMARTGIERLAVLRDAADTARSEAQSSCTAAGFSDPDAALAALLDHEQAEARAADLEGRALRAQAARAVLARADVQAALTTEPPQVEALVEAADTACRVRDDAAATLLDRDRARRRTDRLARDILADLGSWAPVREAAALAGSMASFAEGKGPDNPLRMRLSAYVLGERLREVVEAANERLGSMSGQRYALEQADERGAGDRRGGLSLRVRDEWSGVLRDPMTLSGGETFVVSLALALGLADTVSHEAGGTDIATLFIDEGFGSLDAETLDEVMDTLDALREGGRTVGVVSHVPELRERITARLEVHKTRTGSTVAAH